MVTGCVALWVVQGANQHHGSVTGQCASVSFQRCSLSFAQGRPFRISPSPMRHSPFSKVPRLITVDHESILVHDRWLDRGQRVPVHQEAMGVERRRFVFAVDIVASGL